MSKFIAALCLVSAFSLAEDKPVAPAPERVSLSQQEQMEMHNLSVSFNALAQEQAKAQIALDAFKSSVNNARQALESRAKEIAKAHDCADCTWEGLTLVRPAKAPPAPEKEKSKEKK